MRIAIVCTVLLLGTSSILFAQKNKDFGGTQTTSKSPKYHARHEKRDTRHKIQWVKSNSKGLMIGNPCMERVMDDMGFVYLVQPKGQHLNKSGFQRNMHNFFAKIGIMFRNGPFWKLKLKKWRKRCGAGMGDF